MQMACWNSKMAKTNIKNWYNAAVCNTSPQPSAIPSFAGFDETGMSGI